jgi:hypothetical protein
VTNTMWTVGEDWFLHSFFSTVAYRLEPNGWGSRFPALMKHLYTGRLPAERLPQAREELAAVRAELAELPPEDRIFAYEHPERATPWDVPPGASSVAGCFLTASGRNLLDVLEEAISDASEISADVEIRPFAREGTHDLYVGNTMWRVGQDDFLHSFFSTVAYQVEREGWGSRFQVLMNELYMGRLPKEHVPQAREELQEVRARLSELQPADRVYSYDEPNKPTPWDVPPGAATLADCFLSSSGTNLLDLLARALDVSQEADADVEIRPFSTADSYTYFVTGERENP